jgi:hypothetical protein
MGRAFSSLSMAFCGIIGVLLLFNVCTQIPGVLARATKAGGYDAAWMIAPDLIGAIIGAALLTGAFFFRRRLKASDAKGSI